jgi:hypothetical protein
MNTFTARWSSGDDHDLDATTWGEAVSEARDLMMEPGAWSAPEIGDGMTDEAIVFEVDDDGDSIRQRTVTVDFLPEEPDCESDDGHDWSEEYSQSLGGTAFRHDSACERCGMTRVRTTSGAQRNPGEPGETIVYEEV